MLSENRLYKKAIQIQNSGKTGVNIFLEAFTRLQF